MTDAARSYVHGASSIELRGETVGRRFDLTVSRDPARLALISRHEGVRLACADLAARVDACAAGLIAMGLTHGERIGICAPNGWAWVVTQFATAKAGLILVDIVNNACFVGLQMRLAPEDRLCIPVPMHHCFGMVPGTLCCIAHGATMVFPAAGFDAHETLRTIAEERCAALHGVPDRKYGEEACAWIRLKPGARVTADDVRDFCRGRIAHYKVPRHVRFVDSFPMTVTGKVQKFVMRERMAEELAHRRSGTG